MNILVFHKKVSLKIDTSLRENKCVFSGSILSI